MNKNNYDGLVKRSQEISLKWMKIPAPQRGEYIRLLGEELRKEKEHLASIITKEARKTPSSLLQNQHKQLSKPRRGDHHGHPS